MITNQIIASIAEYLGLTPGDIDKQAELREDMNLSPVELNDLIASLSQKFGVEIPSEELGNIISVDDLIIAIEDNML
ncbi:MAG: Uncharacterized protein G01um101493_340 [Microgenomates group bacterium Gr01-1014_93]|nr:MAG: Uncharacterized protein G01um101493_340 [Microgenomates group bacterium Gr01-1014_93]